MDSIEIAEDVLFKLNVPDGEIIPQTVVQGKHYELDGVPVVINSAGDLVNAKTGKVIKHLGTDVGQKKERFDLAKRRMVQLKDIAELEDDEKPLAGEVARRYMQKRKDELTTALSFVDLVYKQELRNINAKETTFEERTNLLGVLYQKIADDLVSVIEKEVSDTRIKKFTYLFPEHETALKDLLNKRTSADAKETAVINEDIIKIVFGDGIALYYKTLKESN